MPSDCALAAGMASAASRPSRTRRSGIGEAASDAKTYAPARLPGLMRLDQSAGYSEAVAGGGTRSGRAVAAPIAAPMPADSTVSGTVAAAARCQPHT